MKQSRTDSKGSLASQTNKTESEQEIRKRERERERDRPGAGRQTDQTEHYSTAEAKKITKNPSRGLVGVKLEGVHIIRHTMKTKKSFQKPDGEKEEEKVEKKVKERRKTTLPREKK